MTLKYAIELIKHYNDLKLHEQLKKGETPVMNDLLYHDIEHVQELFNKIIEKLFNDQIELLKKEIKGLPF